MNGVHDLGGMHGFGPIVREENEPLFHAEWEAHVRALMSLAVAWGVFNLDAFRYGIERMAPPDYLRAPYYERWLTSVEYNLIEAGILTLDEVDTRTERLRQDPAADQHRAAGEATPRRRSESDERPQPPSAPRFAVGDAVIARNIHPTGHTRLPRYVRGKRGTIHRIHGLAPFPDTNAHGLGEQPQVVYNVRFDSHELWGASAEPHQTLSIDLWESYLDSAPS